MSLKLTMLALLVSANSFAFDYINTNQDKAFDPENMEKIHRGHKEIILTFDDGPTPKVTEKILDVLGQYNIKATFFVIGNNVKDQPRIMQRIVKEGHIVGNHSMSHPKLTEFGFFSWRKKVKEEILGTHELLTPYTQAQKHFYFRAPHAMWDNKFSDLLNQDAIGNQYIGPVLWDIGGEMIQRDGQWVETADWACWSRKLTIDECMSGYIYETEKKKGGVVLMHDLKMNSADMLAKLIPELINRGYTFRNLDDVNWEARSK